MSYFYSDPDREPVPHALPDAEAFMGYAHECTSCSCGTVLVPDYYGLLYQAWESCPTCGDVGTLRITDTARKWWYAWGFPGCLSDSDPVGPFDTEDEAQASAREEAS